jgi:tetratricopeptide (TPR) repeat protein
LLWAVCFSPESIVLKRFLPLIALSAALVALTGCQELKGPVWSSDGRRIAYTSYTQGSAAFLDTSVYCVEADDDTSDAQLVAKNAAYPQWLPDNVSLIFAGDRDAQGFYTKIYKYNKTVNDPQPLLANLHMTSFQLTADGSVGLIVNGRDPRPGSPCTIEVWNASNNKRTPLNSLGELYSPALLSDGAAIAYSQKPADSLPLLGICDLDGTQPRVLFPTEDQNDPTAASYIVHAFPDRDRLLFYGPGSTNLWTMKRDGTAIRRYPLPENLSSPVMVRIDDDGSSAVLTLAQASSEKVIFQAYRLDFAAKKFTHLDEDSMALIGGHAPDPRAVHHNGTNRHAWLSGGGLAVGEPGKARYFPQTANECMAASALQIRQNETDKAVASALKAHELQPPPLDPGDLDRADARAYLAAKQFDPACDSFEKALLLHPIGARGLTFLFPPGTGLPRPAPAETAALLKEMEQLSNAVPTNQLIPLLKRGLESRLKGDYVDAADAYRRASPLCADEATVGGLRFQEAMSAFENGELVHAAEKWEAAARTTDFPQGQYAAALSAIAYSLDGHADAAAKATAVLQLPAAKSGLIATEVAQLLGLVKGLPYRDHSVSKENATADDSLKTWVEIDLYTLPFASLSPVRVQDKDGKFVERHVGVRSVTASAVGLSGAQAPIFRIPCAITIPSISPDKHHLAFAAEGEVFPLNPTFCDVYVIDVRGTVAVGNTNVLNTGVLTSRATVSGLTWTDTTELKISGSTVDVFGGETPYTKTLPVPLDRVVMPIGK